MAAPAPALARPHLSERICREEINSKEVRGVVAGLAVITLEIMFVRIEILEVNIIWHYQLQLTLGEERREHQVKMTPHSQDDGGN